MNRRRFLQSTPALIPALTSAAEQPVVSRLIDTHTHFYDPQRSQGVPWPPKNSKLHRTVLPADWKALAEPLGIRETVVVEASPWVEDNQWILDLAAHETCIVGFVGNLDPTQPDFSHHLQRFAANRLFRGLRWRSDLVSLTQQPERVLDGARQLAALGLSLDLNGGPDMLPHAAKLAEKVPDLRLIINHLGGSGDPRAIKPGWQDNIRLISQQTNVWMKVSALAEQVKGEEGMAPRDAHFYHPILDHLWECFGADRLIYGSNWPVSDRGASYKTVFGIVSDYFRQRGAEASDKYFAKNSQAAYRWIERA